MRNAIAERGHRVPRSLSDRVVCGQCVCISVDECTSTAHADLVSRQSGQCVNGIADNTAHAPFMGEFVGHLPEYVTDVPPATTNELPRL